MKFKKGDRVRVRQWKAMEREFSLDENGRLKTPFCCFVPEMNEYCGKSVTIDSVIISEGCSSYYKIIEDDGIFTWTDVMFEGYAFEYGDEIEISDDGEHWERGFYVGYLDGFKFPYACVASEDRKAFIGEKKFQVSFWKYARPIQRKHTIVIDGKEIEISEESYKRLKESLLK